MWSMKASAFTGRFAFLMGQTVCLSQWMGYFPEAYP